jgi:pimeloyl-ACP methyl ester carboxylesterase
MRRVLVLGCALAVLAFEVGHAQPADPDKQPFSGPELLAGKKMTEAECAVLASAVWVVHDGDAICIRYYPSTAGGEGKEPIVFLSDDVVATNARREVRPLDYYVKSTPAGTQNGSVNWSRRLRVPYLHLGRPGTYGSSGEHAKRRTAQEIALVSAALDAIKARHGYTRLHVVGHGEGGHTAAALLARRADLGCVVLSSALVAVRSRLAELGWQEDVTGNRNPLDPIALVGSIGKRPDLRIFVLTDPDDLVISARSQTVYFRQLAAAGLPAHQIFVAAPDPSAHALWREARDIAAGCAKGDAPGAIVAKYENKKPQTPPDHYDPPLHKADNLEASISETQCSSFATALWVQVEGRGFCVRYWMSTAGGNKEDALLFIQGDLGAYRGDSLELNRASALVTAGHIQREAHYWSRIYKGPYFHVSRMGTYGSSGDHRARRSRLEVQVAMAAVDALKERHGIKRFHPVGQSGGAHTAAAFAQLRRDVGCVVMASGVLSAKAHVRDRGGQITARVKAYYDPIDFVSTMAHETGRRLVALSDPDDRRVSFRSQQEFVERIKAKGLPILHITAAASDEDFHGLSGPGRRLAIDCAADIDDDALVKKYQNKAAPVANR